MTTNCWDIRVLATWSTPHHYCHAIDTAGQMQLRSFYVASLERHGPSSSYMTAVSFSVLQTSASYSHPQLQIGSARNILCVTIKCGLLSLLRCISISLDYYLVGNGNKTCTRYGRLDLHKFPLTYSLTFPLHFKYTISCNSLLPSIHSSPPTTVIVIFIMSSPTLSIKRPNQGPRT